MFYLFMWKNYYILLRDILFYFIYFRESLLYSQSYDPMFYFTNVKRSLYFVKRYFILSMRKFIIVFEERFSILSIWKKYYILLRQILYFIYVKKYYILLREINISKRDGGGRDVLFYLFEKNILFC